MRRAALLAALLLGGACAQSPQGLDKVEGCWLNHSGIEECPSEMDMQQLQDLLEALQSRDTFNGKDIVL